MHGMTIRLGDRQQIVKVQRKSAALALNDEQETKFMCAKLAQLVRTLTGNRY